MEALWASSRGQGPQLPPPAAPWISSVAFGLLLGESEAGGGVVVGTTHLGIGFIGGA